MREEADATEKGRPVQGLWWVQAHMYSGAKNSPNAYAEMSAKEISAKWKPKDSKGGKESAYKLVTQKTKTLTSSHGT
jgi:hypothetical protein